MNTFAPKLLDEQLDFLDQQADLDRWKRDHEMAMLSCDSEDLIALALETLDRIKKRRSHVDAESTLRYFRRWHQVSLRALACVEFAEGEGFQPERADEFRFAINEASIAEDFDRVVAAQQRLDAGMGRSLEDIVNESQAG